MLRAGAVARFAGNVDLAPPRVVTVGLGIVILAQVRRMTARTAAVPVEVRASPVQRIAGFDRLRIDVGVAEALVGRIQMKPALSALHRRPAVPGDIQDLLATVREVDHVLLQGMNAEGVADAKRLQLALRIVGPDPELDRKSVL